MPNNNDASNAGIVVEYTPEFKRNIRHLSKNYRHIKSDVQPVVEDLEAGKSLGDQIKGVNYTVYKVRVKNTDIKKGKRAGYRLIYYIKPTSKIILVTIYSKTEQGDITADKIRHIIEEFDRSIE